MTEAFCIMLLLEKSLNNTTLLLLLGISIISFSGIQSAYADISMSITPVDLQPSSTIKVTGDVTDTADGSYVFLYVTRDDDNSPNPYASEYSVSGNDSYSFEFTTQSYTIPNCYVFTTYIGTSSLSAGSLNYALRTGDSSVYENLVQTTQSVSYNGGQCPETATDNPPSYSEVKKKGNGGCADCAHPTLGVNDRAFRQVEDGFSYNGVTVDVDRSHTEFPLINATVGHKNLITVKIYENSSPTYLERVQFGLGVPLDGSPLDDAEVILIVNFSHNSTAGLFIEDIEIVDSQDLIENDSVAADFSIVKCMESSNNESCVKLNLEYSYREATLYNVVIVNTMDFYRNSWNHYFNDGVQVLGESLNPADTIYSQGIIFTELDKFSNAWIDEEGIQYTKNSVDSFFKLSGQDKPYECNDTPLDETTGPVTRNNCHFRALTDIWGSHE